MDKYILSTERAPAAIGPYSQAVGFGNLLFLSGQIGLNPETGAVIDGGTADQTRQVMTNIERVLEAANLGFENVLKVTIFLANMNDFQVVNEIYGTYFPKNPPARSTVEVSRLPKNVQVEIEVIAAFPTDAP